MKQEGFILATSWTGVNQRCLARPPCLILIRAVMSCFMHSWPQQLRQKQLCVFHIFHKPNVCFQQQFVVKGVCVCVYQKQTSASQSHREFEPHVCVATKPSHTQTNITVAKRQHPSYLGPPASPSVLLSQSEPPRSWCDAQGSRPRCRHKHEP